MRKRYAIKQLALKAGKKPGDMLALTDANDPFYIGSATHYVAGRWARKLYMLMNRPQRVHIRRLHYFALTQPQHTKPSGQIYRNTGADWKFLCDACKFARYLEILPYEAFIDRRSVPKLPPRHTPAGFDSPREWNKLLEERIEALCHAQIKLMLAKLMPVHIEVWVEKSTAADLIEPASEKYGINIITTLGELSLTAVWQFVKRISCCQKPVRIFYISDFDPAGESMPISVSRKIEFLLRRYRLSRKIDLKLRSLMLTRRQCKQFNLPGIPLPVNKKRKFKFARYNGRATTELHALEVTKPGYIRQVLEEELKNYLDPGMLTNATQFAEAAVKQILGPVRVMLCRHHRLTAAVGILEKLLAASWTGAEYDGPWLLESERDYLSQLAAYQHCKSCDDRANVDWPYLHLP